MAHVEDRGRDALREMRRILGVLRRDDEGPELAPQPGIGQVHALIEHARDAGLHVELRVVGDPGPVPAGIDLAAYRIIQESLTNVTRHAGPATATVRVSYGDRDLTVQVDDDGRGQQGQGSSPAGSGKGITGMRERAAALGGDLEAAPRPGGGFRVLALLPLDGSPDGSPDGAR
jgi:signal transduction histidine kinase